MKIIQSKKTTYSLIAYALSMTAICIYFAVFTIKNMNLFFDDFLWRWQECALLCRGINPFDAISNGLYYDNIGKLSPEAGTVPWAFVLGNLINPGFLPYHTAKIYGIGLFFILTIISMFVVYRWSQSALLKKRNLNFAFFFSIAILLQRPLIKSFQYGNQGLIICLLIICAMCIMEKNKFFAGVLLGIAMIKPQIASLFVFIILIKKEYRVFITATLTVFIAWIASFVFTGTAPFEMTTQMLSQGMTYGYYGIFTFLNNFEVNPQICLILSMVTGIAYILLTFILMKKWNIKSDLVLFSATAIASTFWFYKQPHDFCILSIFIMLLIYVFINIPNPSILMYILFTCICCYISLGFFTFSFTTSLFERFLSIGDGVGLNSDISLIVNAIHNFLLMIIGIICLRYMKTNKID